MQVSCEYSTLDRTERRGAVLLGCRMRVLSLGIIDMRARSGPASFTFPDVSFFDVPLPDPPPEPIVERPVWSGPPRGVLPGYSAQKAVVFKTDDTLLVVHRFLVYPNGVEFSLTLVLRDTSYELEDIPWELRGHPGRRLRDDSLPDEFLRFGMLFSDGTKWTNLDWRYPSHDEEPSGPVVSGRGGGGGGDEWEMGYWVWPLPPEGEMTFVASWPLRNIPEQRATVDASELRARAEDAEIIWEN